MQRLQEEGERLTCCINSRAYLLNGERYIEWVHPNPQGSPFLVAKLGPEYGENPYEASIQFLFEQRLAGWPTRSPYDPDD